jgi:hypothetical protein
VRAEVAAHARRAVLAGYFQNEAAKLGLLTPGGLALVEMSTKQDQAASRHATAARVQANMEAAARPAKPFDLARALTEGEP